MIRISIEEDCTACVSGIIPAGSDRIAGLLLGVKVPCSRCKGEKVVRRTLTLAELAEMFDIETTYRTDNRPPESKLVAKPRR